MSKVFKMPTVDEMLQRQEEFFNKNVFLSYSGLTKLMFSPKLFYMHYILNQREDSQDKSMIEGRLIHCLFLNPEDFDKEFVLMATDLPTATHKALLDTLYQYYLVFKSAGDTRTTLYDFKELILQILEDMNLFQTLKTDEQRLTKIITEKNVSYWEYLQNSEGKTNIDLSMFQYATEIVEQIKNNDYILKIMGYVKDNITDNIEKHNEIMLAVANPGFEFGLRGIIDNLVIDHTNKIIRVNDLKKTSKDLNSFTDSIEFYKYWVQAAIYYYLVHNVYLSKPEYKDYSFEFRFIVIDSYTQVAPIKVSEATLVEWIRKTNTELEKADFHFKNRNFDLPYEFLLNNELEI
jgi:hypothetical protein